jgi:hypothetical protein
MANKVVQQECGCVIVHEPVSRSLFIRERWLSMCPAHAAEFQAFRAEARRGHDLRAKEKANIEELV